MYITLIGSNAIPLPPKSSNFIVAQREHWDVVVSWYPKHQWVLHQRFTHWVICPSNHKWLTAHRRYDRIQPYRIALHYLTWQPWMFEWYESSVQLCCGCFNPLRNGFDSLTARLGFGDTTSTCLLKTPFHQGWRSFCITFDIAPFLPDWLTHVVPEKYHQHFRSGLWVFHT